MCMTSPKITADEIKTFSEIGLTNVQAVIYMTSKSKWYDGILMERRQEMAIQGLIIHPTKPTYLTCSHRTRTGCHYRWLDARPLQKPLERKTQRGVYREWRCKKANEPPIFEVEDSYVMPFDTDAPISISGVWAEIKLMTVLIYAVPTPALPTRSLWITW